MKYYHEDPFNLVFSYPEKINRYIDECEYYKDAIEERYKYLIEITGVGVNSDSLYVTFKYKGVEIEDIYLDICSDKTFEHRDLGYALMQLEIEFLLQKEK